MPFIDSILKHKSISFVGMEKNTGKTETLNYVLSRLGALPDIRVGISSIGIDGETVDQVTKTHKPEIFLHEGTIFVSCKQFYLQKEIISNILSVSNRSTALGELIIARAESSGKLILSGASNSLWLKESIEEIRGLGADIVLVDGALSRMSFGSPSITDAMILCTGAALSLNLNTLVKKTVFTYNLTQLPEIEKGLKNKLCNIEKGIFCIDKEENIIELEIPSVLMIEKYKDRLFAYGKRLFISGIITDKLLTFLKSQKDANEIEIIVKDFTKVFAEPETFYSLLSKGGKISVVNKTNLIAITVNPISPSGYSLNSQQIIDELKNQIPLPIYNIKK